jgi:hypothetical protein
MTEPAVRFPYTSVTRLCGSTAKVVATSDRTGVMPLPAAMNA